jgi:hypothetical protein
MNEESTVSIGEDKMKKRLKRWRVNEESRYLRGIKEEMWGVDEDSR